MKPRDVSDEGRLKNGEKPSILRAFKMVAWSFLGIRKKSEYQHDLQNVSPVHVILVGLVLAIAFIAVLVFIVRTVAA